MPLNAHVVMTLTPAERLILANQYAILEALFPADRERYALKRRIVERDLGAEYSNLLPEGKTSQECNRNEDPSRRHRTSGGVNPRGALTPW